MLNKEEIIAIDNELEELYKLRVEGNFGMIQYHMKWTSLLKKKSKLLNLPTIIVEKVSNVRKIG